MSILPSPSCTRLVTITAQVDHGKTTLADSLVEHNGIISERLAGDMRFLDSMEEEQRRGITIRSSAIALKHSFVKKKNSEKKEMVIHLIDSPGHVDFSMEVSSALQICDGALLLVDVVEGMCARTQSILRESFAQRLVPILVINKIDRLCTDLGLNVNEAYLRIRSVIESVNAAASAMIRSDKAKQMAHNDDSNSSSQDQEEGEEDELAQIWSFDPSKGNIVFTSAIYGWGFTIPSLAKSLFKYKIIPQYKPPVLRQYLFGDFKYNSSTGKVLKWKQNAAADDNNVAMFAEYGLKPLWQCFTGVSMATMSLGMTSVFFTSNQYQLQQQDTRNNDHNKGTKKQSDVKIKATSSGMNDVTLPSLNIGITCPEDAQSSLQPPRTVDEMQQLLNKTNASSEELILRALLRRHRPLSEAILDAVCDICPSPADASSHVRQDALSLIKDNSESESDNNNNSDDAIGYKEIQNAIRNCDTSSNVPATAHCSKFVSTTRASVNDAELISYLDSIHECHEVENANVINQTRPKDSVIIMGVGRVLSGILHSKDIEYYCYGPKYESKRDKQFLPRKSIRLYIIMGSSFVRVGSVPAGHFCAIHGLEDLQLKTVTICSSPHAMPLAVIDRGIRPLVKVNVEATSALDTSILEQGLAKLSLADPAVEIIATAKGERILACLGEIHLEQSILDLKNLYCGVKINLRISDQIVEFGESTTWFENEKSDFKQFYNFRSQPLRQTMIPPYCYEDGLSLANNGRSRAILSNKAIALHVRVIPLPITVYDSLVKKEKVDNCNDDLVLLSKALGFESKNSEDILNLLKTHQMCLDNRGNAMIKSPNMIIHGVESNDGEVYVPPSKENSNEKSDYRENDDEENRAKVVYDLVRKMISESKRSDESSEIDKYVHKMWSDLQGSCTAGFQAGCAAGPLCEEPVRSVLVLLEAIEIAVKKDSSKSENKYSIAKPVSGGMIVASLKTGIRTSLLTRPARLVESYLRLTLHSSLTGLGPLYAILSKRRGRVVSDTMVDGTELISIDARLPQSESVGLTPELLQKSSGEVTAPELIFSHWEILDEDPFWIPTSLEEREDYGEIVLNGDTSTGINNTALKYIRMVRDRKGLIVDSNKIIVAAEKQRTLARKK